MAIMFGINGLLIAIIIAALQRNVCFSIVTERKIIKGSLLNSLKRQLIMVALIVFGAFIGMEFVFENSVTILQWICYASVTFLIISVVVIAVFSATDIRTAKIIFDNLKAKFKKRKIV